MAEKDKPLIKIAEFSPGLSTAVAQSNLPKNEFNAIEADNKNVIKLPLLIAFAKFVVNDV